MTLFEKIKEYLEAKEKDFAEGLNLFLMVSNHHSLALYLQRKKDATKLEYELSKLLKTLPAKLQKITMPEKPIAHESNDNRTSENEGTDDSAHQGTETNNSQGNNGNTGAASTEDGTQKTEYNSATGQHKNDEDSDHKIIEFKKINPEDLPEEMRPLYHEISEKHKEMRSVHEKMKLAETDEERAELRTSLILLDDAVKAGWDIIDEYFLLQQQGTKEEIVEKAKEPLEAINELGKSINAARSYISRGINDFKKAPEEKKQDLKNKIIKRIDLLIENKVPVARETKGTLVELKIIAKNSKLLVE